MAERAAIRPPSALVVVGTLAGLVVLLFGMREFNEILAPFFLTISLFIAAYPIQPRLEKAGVPRVVASTILGLLVFAILLVLSGVMYVYSRRNHVDHKNVNDDWVEDVTDRQIPVRTH